MSELPKDTVHIVLVNQKVKDIKLPRTDALEEEMGKLYRGLRKHAYIPGEKVPADLKPRNVDAEGVFWADIDGQELSSDLDLTIHVRFPLDLKGYQGPMDVEQICSQAPGVRIDDGGNIQNMIRNLLSIVADDALRTFLASNNSEVQVTIASSSDPFVKVPKALADRFRAISTSYPLNLPDRFAVQTPLKVAGQEKTLAITSEAKKTGGALEQLVGSDPRFADACQRATCFVSSDPLFAQLQQRNFTQPPYTYLLNSSSAFRTDAATQSYNQCVLLPMNNDEAAEFCRILEQRKLDMELGKIQRPPFPSPFMPNGKDVDRDALVQLDRSTEMLRAYIPLKRHIHRLGVTSPITFGKEGGLVVGTGHDEVACFTSTPHPDREMSLLTEFGDEALVERNRRYEVGAGDGAATFFLFFAAVDPLIFIQPHLQGREGENRPLLEIASTVLVNVLSRIGGNFVVRNQETNWSNIRPDAFFTLFREAAQESLAVARKMVLGFTSGQVAQAAIERWGIQVLVWRLRTIAYPGSNKPE